MPIHDRIYRRMEHPPRRARGSPAVVIAQSLRPYLLRGWFSRLCYWGAWVPTTIVCIAVYIISRSEGIQRFISQFTGGGQVALDTWSDEQWYRLGSNGVFWSIGSVQSWFAVMLTAFVGASQIANDVRSHAFEVYLARPISSLDYLLGKLLVVMRPLLVVTVLPCLVFLLVCNLLIDGSFRPCLKLYPLAIVSGIALSFLHAILILGISAFNRSARYATILWFCVCFVSFIVQQVFKGHNMGPEFDLVSFRANVQIVIANLLDLQPLPGFDTEVSGFDRSPWASVLILASLGAGSLFAITRRLSAGRLP